MNTQNVIDYYNKWGGNALDFTEMLWKKANFAKQNDKKIYAYDGLKTGAELEKILSIADNLAVKGVIK